MGVVIAELAEIEGNDGMELFEMVREMGNGENGFVNSLYSDSYEEFKRKVSRNHEISRGIDLPEGYVPQTLYWLFDQGEAVGYGKLRHHLNEKLLEHGGHIGYAIRPAARGKGYGKQLLAGLYRQAKEKGIVRVLLTCDEDNAASRRNIEWNGGKLAAVSNGICKYWIEAEH